MEATKRQKCVSRARCATAPWLLAVPLDWLTECGSFLSSRELCGLSATCRLLHDLIWQPARANTGGRRLFRVLQFDAASAGRLVEHVMAVTQLVAKRFRGQLSVNEWRMVDATPSDTLDLLRHCTAAAANTDSIRAPQRVRFGRSPLLNAHLALDAWHLLVFLFALVCFQDAQDGRGGGTQLNVDALLTVRAGLRIADAHHFRRWNEHDRDRMRKRLMQPQPFLPHVRVVELRTEPIALALSAVKIRDREPLANDASQLCFFVHCGGE